jgi:hypothetical protein
MSGYDLSRVSEMLCLRRAVPTQFANRVKNYTNRSFFVQSPNTGLAIESLTNAPWNTIPYPQPEATKGCATSLIEELVRESQRLQFNGIVKAITIPSARPFYRKIGFIETDGSGEMILTCDAAQEFLIRQQQLRELHHDTGN